MFDITDARCNHEVQRVVCLLHLQVDCARWIRPLPRQYKKQPKAHIHRTLGASDGYVRCLGLHNVKAFQISPLIGFSSLCAKQVAAKFR